MAIPDGKMSAVPIEAPYLVPDERDRISLLEDYELGPIALSDVSQTLRYQNWGMVYNASNFTLTPETTGSPSVVHTSVDTEQISFCFDQNGNIAIVYIDNTTDGHLYWFDPTPSNYVVLDLPDPIVGAMLSLDDKRDLQSAASDALLWYTRKIGEQHNLYQRIQRERFTIEHLMVENVYPFIYKAGMHEELRGQLIIGGPQGTELPPIEPPGPGNPQANLDFELGDVYWDKTGNVVINTSEPYEGSWSAMMGVSSGGSAPHELFIPNCKTTHSQRQFDNGDSGYNFIDEGMQIGDPIIISDSLYADGNYNLAVVNSTTFRVDDGFPGGASEISDITVTLSSVPTSTIAKLENTVYTALSPTEPAYVSCLVKGSLPTEIQLGFRFYNASKVLVSTSVATKSVTTSWVQISHSSAVPANAVYLRAYVTSNTNTDGLISFDNFNYQNTISPVDPYQVYLGALVNFTVDLGTNELFEVET